MKSTDPGITWLEDKPLGLAERLYLPLFVQGLATTARHLVSRKVTVSYPEQRPTVGNPLICRGVRRLNRDAEGRVKCVACFLCATACPAHCIDIVATESPWPDREKYPEAFQIDELRCIFCGMCEEACPVDAIELTSLLDLTGKSTEHDKFGRFVGHIGMVETLEEFFYFCDALFDGVQGCFGTLIANQHLRLRASVHHKDIRSILLQHVAV